MSKREEFCRHCDSLIKNPADIRFYDGFIVCSGCRDQLRLPGRLAVEDKSAVYVQPDSLTRFKTPAVFIGAIGVIGILVDRFWHISEKLDYFNVPAMHTSVALLVVSFVINAALVYRYVMCRRGRNYCEVFVRPEKKVQVAEVPTCEPIKPAQTNLWRRM